jgi:CDP-diacylglycerol--glycerol-3-phosphate 3-phosphatidyltransferase
MNLPNKITLTRILLIPFVILFLLVDFQLGGINYGANILPYKHLIALAIFLIAAATDGIDGYIARKNNLVTNLGKFLDPLADKLLIMASLIALVEMSRVSAWIAIIIITRELAVTGLRLLAVADGTVIAASNLGKWKTATQIVAIALLIIDNYPFGLYDLPLALIFIWLAVIITVISGIDYFYKNLHVFKGKPQIKNKELIHKLQEDRISLATAESLTGGLISKLLVDVAGSSSVFYGGVTAYNNQIKHDILGIADATLNTYGAVSNETAIEMADNVRKLYKTEIGLAVTGIAGPEAVEDKPVGLVYCAISMKNSDTISYELYLCGSREEIKMATAEQAITLLFEYISKI